jgi:hypothetical protein
MSVRIGVASRVESPAASADELVEFAAAALRREEGNRAEISLWLP